jgi:site-specific DNA-methyltransferase (adenine-specific)
VSVPRKDVIGECELWCGDCREVLPTLGRVDAVVTDPPYGVGFKYASHDDRPEAYEGGYSAWLMSRLEACEMLCSPGSPVFVWQAGPHIRHFREWSPRDWRLFCAAKNFVQMRPTPMQWAFDPVVVWWVPGLRPWSAGTATRDFHVANTAPVIGQASSIERQHPCPRPIDQVEHVVEQWVRPEATVLDPFMGSGTTGVACVRLGRRFIGVEIDERYFDIACRRIEAEYRQPRLFAEPPPKPVQTTMLLDAEAGQ